MKLNKLKTIINDESGAAAIEMAFVGVFMGIMIIPLIDLADLTFTSMKLGSAVNSSVLYATKNPSDTGSIHTIIEHTGGLDATKLTVNAVNFCECDGAEMTCTSPCNTGIEKYMTISASFARPLMFSYPGVDNPYTITKERTVRVE